MKARRRGRGEGSVYQRASDKRWTSTLPGGRKAFYAATKAEAMAKRARWLADRPPERDGRTLGAYLDEWLSRKRKLRPQTRDTYAGLLKRIKETIGTTRLQALTSDDVEKMVERITQSVSSSRAHYCRSLLATALKTAVKRKLIRHNPAQDVESTYGERRQPPTITPADASRILAAVRGDKWEPLYVTLLSTGLRINEALGLSWSDVDLDAGTLTIRHQVIHPNGGSWQLAPPKSKAGIRLAPIPAEVVEQLRQQRRNQRDLRDLSGSSWVEHGLVFTTMLGTPVSDNNARSHFKLLLRRAGLPAMRPHDLRHGAASLWHALGVPAKTISAMLGHSTIGTTMDLYTHVSGEVRREAAEAMGEVLRGRKEASG